jgi:hypothetical protein
MTGRKCSTCKHYDPAPIWRKGWCRNPLLYSPQQSHLVGEDDLDCERGMGNYWEASDERAAELELGSMHGVIHSAPIHIYGQADSPVPDLAMRRVYPVSGSSGYRDDPPVDDLDDERNAVPGGSGRQIEYYAEERYWTDYLRIILPIIGVLLFLILLYLWALAFLRGDDDTPGQAGTSPTSTIPLITADATGTAAVEITGTPGGPGIVLTPAPVGNTPQPSGSTPNPTASTPDEPSGEIYVGAVVAIANTGGTGANLRSLPTTESEVVTVLLDGVELVVIDGPEDAQGFTWWGVEGETGTGWVVGDYLEVIE